MILVGCGVIGYGVTLLMTRRPVDEVLAVGIWAGGAVVVHDGILAPLVVLAGLAVALRLPGPWRRALLWFVVVLGPMTLVAVPVLGRFGARPDNPTLLDRPYLLGYAVVALLSAAIALVGLRRTREDPT